MYLLLITHADDGRVLGSWRALCAYLVHFMRVTLLVSFLCGHNPPSPLLRPPSALCARALLCARFRRARALSEECSNRGEGDTTLTS